MIRSSRYRQIADTLDFARVSAEAKGNFWSDRKTLEHYHALVQQHFTPEIIETHFGEFGDIEYVPFDEIASIKRSYSTPIHYLPFVRIGSVELRFHRDDLTVSAECMANFGQVCSYYQGITPAFLRAWWNRPVRLGKAKLNRNRAFVIRDQVVGVETDIHNVRRVSALYSAGVKTCRLFSFRDAFMSNGDRLCWGIEVM